MLVLIGVFVSRNLVIVLLGYIIWNPVFTNPDLRFQEDDFSVYTKGTFMSVCCEYEITQKQGLFLEKSLCKYQIDAIFFDKKNSIKTSFY